jgi:hypothetical protein
MKYWLIGAIAGGIFGWFGALLTPFSVLPAFWIFQFLSGIGIALPVVFVPLLLNILFWALVGGIAGLIFQLRR